MAIADDVDQLGKNQAALQKNLLTLKKRLDRLESRVDDIAGDDEAQEEEEARTAPQPARRTAAKETSKPIENLGFKIFGAVGFGLILLGLIFLYRYAVELGMLTYGGRIVIGVLFSVAFVIAGEILRRKAYEKYGQLLTGGGLGLLYFTFYAAYAFPASRAALGITAMVDYLLLFIVLIAALALALRNDSPLLTAYAFVLGYGAPLLIGAADRAMSIHAVMIPTVLLSIALAIILKYKPWKLGIFGAVATFLVYAITFGQQHVIRYVAAGAVPSIVGPAFFYLLLLAVLWSVLTLYLPDDASNVQNVIIAIVAAASLVGFGLTIVWKYWETYNGAFLVLLAAAYLGLTGLAKMRNLRIMFEAFFIICIALVTIAIPVQLDKYWIAIAWAIEGALLVRSGVRVEVRGLRVLGYAALGLAVINTLGWGTQLPTAERLLSYIATIGALYASAYFLSLDAEKDERKSFVMGVLAIAGTVLLTILLAVEIWDPAGIFASMSRNAKHVLLSVLWALEAIACIGIGFLGRSQSFRIMGALLFGITVLKVLFFDIDALNGLYRTVVTILVGLIALGGAFAYIKNKEGIESYLRGGK